METSPETFEGDFLELQEPSPQQNLSFYYNFIEGGSVIPHKFSTLSSWKLKNKEEGHIDA